MIPVSMISLQMAHTLPGAVLREMGLFRRVIPNSIILKLVLFDFDIQKSKVSSACVKTDKFSFTTVLKGSWFIYKSYGFYHCYYTNG